MIDEWRTATIEEVAEKVGMGPFGSSIKVETFVDEGVPIISGQHLSGTRLFDAEHNYITIEHAERLKNANVYRGDVIFTHAGNIGQVAYIPETSTFDRYVISQRQFYMRCDRSKVIPEFITYFFKTPEGQHRLLANTSSSGVPSIAQPVSYLKTIDVPVPPLLEQHAIAAILGALDDKIELNRRMNQTLEAMAETLFKSWFIDFEPFHDQDMEDSPLGLIPRGWEIKVLHDLTDFVVGGDWGKDDLQGDATEPAYCVRGADIPNLQHGGIGKMPVRYLKPSSLRIRSLCAGDIAIEISGGSPTQSTGRAVLVTSQLLNRIDHPLVYSNFCRLIRLRPSISPNFVYFWLRRLYEADDFLQYETGTTGIKNFAYTTFSNTHHLALPPAEVLNAFDERVQPLLTRHAHNGVESESLANIRDTLLPKLLSGELRVTDAEKFMEVKI